MTEIEKHLHGEVARLRRELAELKFNHDRAFGILARMATERCGFTAIFGRWYYPDEPLRNDAARLIVDVGLPADAKADLPRGTRLLDRR